MMTDGLEITYCRVDCFCVVNLFGISTILTVMVIFVPIILLLGLEIGMYLVNITTLPPDVMCDRCGTNVNCKEEDPLNA